MVTIFIKFAGTGDWFCCVVSGDAAAHDHSRSEVNVIQSRFQNVTANVIEVDVHFVGTGGLDLLADVALFVIYDLIEARLFLQPCALFAPPAMPTTRQPLMRAIWPATEPVAPAAPETSTVSPGLGSPRSSSPK